MASIKSHTVTASDLLLLRAVLAKEDVAIRAWAEWQQNFQLSDIDENGYALLPQLYQRLSRLNVPESSLLKLKGIYRHTWCHNQAMMACMAGVFSRLQERGIECLLVGQAAALAAEECAALPIRTCAFLVPASQFSSATAFFRAEQWSQWTGYDAAEPRLNPYLNFTHDGTTCSIYRSLFAGWDTSWGDEECWMHADTYACHHTSVRALCPTDQLLTVLLDIGHGYRPLSPRTVADIGTLLQGASKRIDWDRFRTTVDRLYITLPIKRAVAELSALSLLTLPASLVTVAGLATTWAEYQEDNTIQGRSARARIAGSLGHHWCRYRREDKKESSLTGFVKYLQSRWKAQAVWGVPAIAMKKLGRSIQ